MVDVGRLQVLELQRTASEPSPSDFKREFDCHDTLLFTELGFSYVPMSVPLDSGNRALLSPCANAIRRPESLPRTLLRSVHTLPEQIDRVVTFIDHTPKQIS